MSAETKAKMSESHKHISDETRAKMSAARVLRPPASAETRAKRSAALTGIKRSAETIAKMRARRLERPPSAETIAQRTINVAKNKALRLLDMTPIETLTKRDAYVPTPLQLKAMQEEKWDAIIEQLSHVTHDPITKGYKPLCCFVVKTPDGIKLSPPATMDKLSYVAAAWVKEHKWSPDCLLQCSQLLREIKLEEKKQKLLEQKAAITVAKKALKAASKGRK
jgi:hypothetical protein